MLRKALLYAAATAVVMLAAFAAIEARQAEPELERLSDGVYAFIGVEGATNSGFVVTDEGVIVIDTQGPRGLSLLLKKKIRSVTGKPVIYVINTHYHGDHTFGNQHFKEARAIIAHEGARSALIEQDVAHRERFKRFFGEKSLEGFTLTLPTMTFSNSLAIRSGKKTVVLVHPGVAHTRGDAFVYLPEDNIVFAGDLLYNGRLPWLGDGETSGSVRAVDALLESGAGVLVPGHGGVTDRDGALYYRKYLTDLRSEVGRLYTDGKTLDEVKKEITLPEYSGLIKYSEWLPMNAEKVYSEIAEARRAAPTLP